VSSSLPDIDLPRGIGGHVLGTVLAGLAAALFAVGSVAVHAATAGSATTGGGAAPSWRVLLRRPAWLVGQGAAVAAALLQVVALGLAPVAVVQPVLAGGLVIALALRALLDRAAPTLLQVLGALCTTAGLAVFLVAAQPGPATRPAALLPVAASAAAVVVLAAATTRLPRGAGGSVPAALVAGVSLGVAAVLVSAALEVLQRHGLLAALTSGATWAAVATAVAAQYASQQAFARGNLAVSLPTLTVVDPLAAVPIAGALLGERLAPGHAGVWGPAALLAAVGVVLLGQERRSPSAVQETPSR
jgi:drug/metabolite transporter (DMT)-like permease